MKEITKRGRRKSIVDRLVVETERQRGNYLNLQHQFFMISTKVLIINGKNDTNNPPFYVQQLHQSLPNSKLVLLDSARHFPWIKNSEKTFSKIKVWLKQVEMLQNKTKEK